MKGRYQNHQSKRDTPYSGQIEVSAFFDQGRMLDP
jgi:hypothetical protein